MIKIHKYEAIGIAVSIGAMALALFIMRFSGQLDGDVFARSAERANNQAAVVTSENGVEGAPAAIASALTGNRVTKLVVTDIALGTGEEVEEGDEVEVHYIATLQNGQEFDNSYKKGDSFTFEVGDDKVIEGWNAGMVGMKVGGQRVIIIPSDMAYGHDGYGPIPGNATVVYAIELLSVK
jgi:FKBP-type peptidyl-prolyl cis-trans isomerase